MYNRLSLTRSRRDPLKHFEICIIDILDLQNEENTNRTSSFHNSSFSLKYILKIMWKRGENAPKEQFLLLSTNFLLPDVGFLEQEPDFLFEISGYLRKPKSR